MVAILSIDQKLYKSIFHKDLTRKMQFLKSFSKVWACNLDELWPPKFDPSCQIQDNNRTNAECEKLKEKNQGFFCPYRPPFTSHNKFTLSLKIYGVSRNKKIYKISGAFARGLPLKCLNYSAALPSKGNSFFVKTF